MYFNIKVQVQVRNSSKQLQKNLCTVSANIVETIFFVDYILSSGAEKRIFCSCCGEFLIYTWAFNWRYMTLPLPFTTLLYNNTNDFWCNIVNNYVEICIFILTTTFAKKMRYFLSYSANYHWFGSSSNWLILYVLCNFCTHYNITYLLLTKTDQPNKCSFFNQVTSSFQTNKKDDIFD